MPDQTTVRIYLFSTHLPLLHKSYTGFMHYVCRMFSVADIRTICVCGAGTMGSGIAQVAAMAGYTTILFDVNETMLERSKIAIEASLQKLVEKSKITGEEKLTIVNRISFTNLIDDCRADVIIEAIIERIETKVELFNHLAAVNSGNTIFATNTSSLSVNSIAEGTSIVDRVGGMHFFNPPVLMKLVEIIRTDNTDEAVIEVLVVVAKQMGKIPVVCKDAPGFIVNRVARHYYLEAMKMVEEGMADTKTIDAVMEATGFKMGPYRLMDLIGIDINYSVSNIVWEALGKPERLRPSALQKMKVDKGELGRKTGKGFYTY